MCMFGVPCEIMIYNGKQFISIGFQDFYTEWNIKLSFVIPSIPQTNVQAESTNKTIIFTFRKQLKKTKGRWANELLGFIWLYRTTTQTSTGAIPFSLVYRIESVIPVETRVPTSQYQFASKD